MKKKEFNLLIGFLGVVIGFAAYYFGYRNLTAQAEELSAQNDVMKAQIAHLESLKANQDFYVSETERYVQDINTIIADFPSNVLPEDDMKLAYETDNVNAIGYIWINAMSFDEPETIYTTNQTVVTAEDGSPVVADLQIPTYYLLQEKVNMGIECSYDGMKNYVLKILRQNDKKSIDSISLAYSENSGQLEGSALMSSYFIVGQDKPYAQPVLAPVQIGTDNVFGTIQLAPEEGEEEGAEETESQTAQ